MKSILRLLPVALLLAATSSASAAIVYGGLVNIPIPYTFDGIYLNVITGATTTSEPGDFYSSPSSAWIGMDFAGVDVVNGDGLSPLIVAPDQVVNLVYNTPVDSSGTFAAGPSASTSHLGPAPGQFQPSVSGFIGFRMNPSGGGDQYGWLHVSLNDDLSGGTIHSYAYESTIGMPIGAGVPEPAVVTSLLAVVGLGMCRRAGRGVYGV